jgi:hypothetical protein
MTEFTRDGVYGTERCPGLGTSRPSRPPPGVFPRIPGHMQDLRSENALTTRFTTRVWASGDLLRPRRAILRLWTVRDGFVIDGFNARSDDSDEIEGGSAMWYCDKCGGLIEDPKQGWVQWVSYYNAEGRPTGRDLQLVHKTRECRFNSAVEFAKDGGHVYDMGLDHFLRWPDGLMELLFLASEGELPLESVLEMIKRLHIPNYEAARPFFEEAKREGVIEPNMGPGYYFQSDLEAIISWARKSGRIGNEWFTPSELHPGWPDSRHGKGVDR